MDDAFDRGHWARLAFDGVEFEQADDHEDRDGVDAEVSRFRNLDRKVACGAHEEEHRDREQHVRAGCDTCASAGCGSVRKSGSARSGLSCGLDHDLLIRPNDEPNVCPHSGGESRAGEDAYAVGVVPVVSQLVVLGAE